eukprot:696148_1
MFTPKRALLVVFVIVAIEMGLTGAYNARNARTLDDINNATMPNAYPRHQQYRYNVPPTRVANNPLLGSYGSGYSQAPPPSANNQSSNQLRSLILSAVIIIIIILSRILACFENKNCQRAAAILNYLSTGVLVVMLYFIYNDIILSVH